MSFKDKIAVVTGAGSGIGRALAIQLAQAGARVAISDINPSGLDETLRQMRQTGQTGTVIAKAYKVDVSSAVAVFDHAADVRRDFGPAHFVFNNAGATLVGTVEHTSVEEFEWQLGINMGGVLYGTKAFLPQMLAQREGCIINISSVFGMVGYPCQAAYCMSKFAVRGLTETLWQELEGTGVRAVCVHPGGIKTHIETAGRRVHQADATEAGFSALAAKLLITPPEACAAAILAGVRKGRKRIVTGNKARSLFWITRLLPNRYPAILKLMA